MEIIWIWSSEQKSGLEIYIGKSRSQRCYAKEAITQRECVQWGKRRVASLPEGYQHLRDRRNRRWRGNDWRWRSEIKRVKNKFREINLGHNDVHRICTGDIPTDFGKNGFHVVVGQKPERNTMSY